MIWALKQEKVLNINFERGSAMDKFSNFNPKVCFLFFVFAVLLILLNFNPIFLVISLLAGVIYNAMLQGKKAFKTFFAFLLPFTILIGLFNMAFTSYGIDVLFSISNKNFTAEGLAYGLAFKLFVCFEQRQIYVCFFKTCAKFDACFDYDAFLYSTFKKKCSGN